jgi:lipopolysaccharide/colanic/teichoic acid biosynthesis glycosyltransferase
MQFHICMETLRPFEPICATEESHRKPRRPKRYERFGEVIRYLTLDELQQLFDSMDNYTHGVLPG